jgi:hypothetical protein
MVRQGSRVRQGGRCSLEALRNRRRGGPLLLTLRAADVLRGRRADPRKALRARGGVPARGGRRSLPGGSRGPQRQRPSCGRDGLPKDPHARGLEKGAKEGTSFVSYVDYLANNGYVSPGSTEWVDEIREIGNDANHEIFDITPDEARSAVDFVSMLLQIVYEFPERGRESVAARKAKDQGQNPPP